jgi:hypothetical protein
MRSVLAAKDMNSRNATPGVAVEAKQIRPPEIPPVRKRGPGRPRKDGTPKANDLVASNSTEITKTNLRALGTTKSQQKPKLKQGKKYKQSTSVERKPKNQEKRQRQLEVQQQPYICKPQRLSVLRSGSAIPTGELTMLVGQISAMSEQLMAPPKSRE